jgi:hypothetical protein
MIGGTMVQFVKTFEERVADAAKGLENSIKDLEIKTKKKFIETFDKAIYSIEIVLVNEGISLDQEADDALAVLKHKLSDLKDEITAKEDALKEQP